MNPVRNFIKRDGENDISNGVNPVRNFDLNWKSKSSMLSVLEILFKMVSGELRKEVFLTG